MNNKPESLCHSSRASSHIYELPLSTIVKILNSAIIKLRATNSKLEHSFNQSQRMYSGLNIEEIIDNLCQSKSEIDKCFIYPIYGQSVYPIKSSIDKRNEILAHLNIMMATLNMKLKQNPSLGISFSTEMELLDNMRKLFHEKIFNSPLFRRISKDRTTSCRERVYVLV